ncbi:MAG: hypothetical protein WCO09_00240 [bacterium]
MKTNTYMFIGSIIMGIILSNMYLNHVQDKLATPATTIANTASSTVFRDPSGNFYIPMTLGAAKALCEHTKTDVRLAGNALDNVSVWPIRANFIACMGDGGELWVYTYDAKYEWVKATGKNSPNLETTVYVTFKGSPKD